jgi:RecA-family ATPase
MTVHAFDFQPVDEDEQRIRPDDAGGALRWIDMSNWDTESVPVRQWTIRDCVPLHQVGLFSGEGGTGKSILELTKNVAHVTGKDWLGLLPELGPAIYIGAEDSKDEIHIRLAGITQHYGVSFKELAAGGLHILCLLSEDATLCSANGKSGKIETTDLYQKIYEAAGDIKPKNISIDTLSRAFAGDEIDRVQVYAFANYMQKIAMVADGSVTILSHPSLAGMNSGLSNLDKAAREAQAERVFLDLLNRFSNEGRSVSHKSSAPGNYAPRIFAAEAEVKTANLRRADLEEAMRRLFANGKIVVESYGKPSNKHERIVVKNA